MKIKDLTTHPSNPRKITDEKLKWLGESIKKFGDLGQIVFNRKTGNLVSGHQRLKVLPTDLDVVVDTQDSGHIDFNGDRFPVRFVDWSDVDEKTAMISANKQGGDWDYPMLKDLIIALDTGAMPIELTGFNQIELESMFGPMDIPTTNIEIDESKLSETDKECPSCGFKWS